MSTSHIGRFRTMRERSGVGVFISSGGWTSVHVLMFVDRPAGLGGIETHVAALSRSLVRLGARVSIGFRDLEYGGLLESAAQGGVAVLKLDRSDLTEYIAREGVDIVHAHSCGAARWGTRHAKQAGVKLVLTLHGPEQDLPSNPSAVDRFIAVSEEAARPLRYLGRRLAVIENGVDLQRFRPGSGRGRSMAGRPLRAVYLGRVGPAKRQGLEALAQATHSRDDVSITYLSNWAPSGQTHPTVDPAPALANADLVFSTGRGIREAMASGAAACVLGIYWDGLVTPDNFAHLRYHNFSGRATRRIPRPADIAGAIHTLTSAPRRLAALSEFGPRAAADYWDIEDQAARTMALYQELL